jgi:cupin fold WbuC family metalloprotein
MKLSGISTQTRPQVFHSNSWNLVVDEEIIRDLIDEAGKNASNKARLCLHLDSEELMQVTYLAFVAPYEDQIHSHPHRPEVLIPVLGDAEARVFDYQGNVLSTQIMRGKSGEAFSSAIGTWHGLKVLTPEFVMIEIGLGPFTSDSTVFLNQKGGQ